MNERILIVDDEEITRKSLTINLGKEGFQIEGAQDGQIAIDKMRQGGPDYYDRMPDPTRSSSVPTRTRK